MNWQRIGLATGLALGVAACVAPAAFAQIPGFAPATEDQDTAPPAQGNAGDAGGAPVHVDHSQPAPQHTIGPKVIVKADLTAQRVHVTFPDGTEETWPIASGRPGLDTPDGHYKPQWIDPDHVSKQYQDAPMPYAVFFDLKGHAFHGSYQKTFGRAVSHGCIRLPVADAKKLFDAIKVSGADIEVMGHAGRVPNELLVREDANEAAAGYGANGAAAVTPQPQAGYAPPPQQNAYWARRPVQPPQPQPRGGGFLDELFGGN